MTFSDSNLLYHIVCLVSGHLSKGLLQLLIDCLELLLFSHQFILKAIHLILEKSIGFLEVMIVEWKGECFILP